MHIDRPMVSLFFEIKRNMPFDERDEMRIAAPDVGEKLISVYRGSQNQALKTLIENFMALAGSDWTRRLDVPKKSKLMFYRGLAVE